MATAFLDNGRLLARYNSWINQRLYEACEKLTDEERKRERGAFFGSIHKTLNHLIVTDQVWLRRFARSGAENGMCFAALEGGLVDIPEAYQLDMVPFEDWSDLKAKRVQLDAAIERWVADMPEAYPQMTMRYSNSRGVQREHPAWQAMTHFFNHQTHHRGQATTLLMQAGVDIGVTDLLALM
ncbi:MAG: DinB family protein [Pseudomonadota bacterium]